MAKGGNTILAHGITWAYTDDTLPKNLVALQKQWEFEDVDIQDVAPPLKQSKLLARKEYLFLLLLFPIYDRETKKIRAVEVDIFIGPDYLVTINQGNQMAPLADLWGRARKDSETRNELLDGGIINATHGLLRGLIESVGPMLVHISNDIDAVQSSIETNYEKGTIYDILRIKTNIANIRKALQGHKLAFERLIHESENIFSPKAASRELYDLIAKSIEHWDALEGYRTAIDALHQTNESLISFRVNEIMKTLTIFAVIVFPLTLIAAIFGMNTSGAMPFLHNPYGFWIVIGLMLGASLLMYEFFRHRKWL